MVSWLKRLLNWSLCWQIEFLTAAIIMVSIISLVFIWKPTEPHIRITGLVLQLAGLYTILYGILKTRRLFGLPSPLSSAITRLRAFPRWYPRPIRITVNDTIGNVVSFGRVTMKHKPAPGASLVERIRSIEINLDSLDRTVIALQQQFDEAEQSRTQIQNEERAIRKAEIRALSQKLELTETGGLDLSLGGLIWLAIGLIMSTASPELAKWFGG